VKIRPLLPETDLARIAPLPTEQKWKALESFRLGVPPYSYKPLRSNIADLDLPGFSGEPFSPSGRWP
jgi:hypothetical protein